MKYITYKELLRTPTSVDIYVCVKQIWENGNEYVGFLDTPRTKSGFSFFVSDVTAEYIFPDKSPITAKCGDLVYIPKGEMYKVRFSGGGFDPDLYTLNFNLYDKEGDCLVLSDGLTVYKNVLSPKLIDTVRTLADSMILDESIPRRQSLFYELIDTVCKQFCETENDFYPIREGVRLLTSEWSKNERISRYSDACGISEGCFYYYFKRWCGLSPVEYRNRIRLNTARQLLLNTDIPISEIALTTGFDDPYYFSRIFKKSVGISPRGYRRTVH